MALSLGLDVARSSLAATASQIAVVSRNVTLAGNSNAVRKIADVVTGAGGGVSVGRISRDSDALLLDKYLTSNSLAKSGDAVATALGNIQAASGDTDQERSPAALIGKLDGALQRYSASPQSVASASAVISAAKDLATALNAASVAVSGVRQQANSDIAASVANINVLLDKFGILNNEIVEGTRAGRDVTDAQDARDGVLKDLSGEIGIHTVSRDDGDLAVYTESGVTMFDKVARSATMSSSGPLVNGQSGAPVYIDGVAVAGPSQIMAVRTGAISGLVAVRDQIAPAHEAKLDEIARGLIEAFAEHDQSASPVLPPAAGLFTYPGAPAVPPSGVVSDGLAGMISINVNVDPSAGGQPLRLRDGGISIPSNPVYNYNPGGAASYGDRIQELSAELNKARAFDPVAGLGASSTLADYSNATTSALEEQRQSAVSESSYRNIVSDRAATALSKETGVNLDEEMSRMLDLERTYQASARLLTAIDTLLSTLLDAVR